MRFFEGLDGDVFGGFGEMRLLEVFWMKWGFSGVCLWFIWLVRNVLFLEVFDVLFYETDENQLT